MHCNPSVAVVSVDPRPHQLLVLVFPEGKKLSLFWGGSISFLCQLFPSSEGKRESTIASVTTNSLSSSLLVLNNISELLGLDAFQLSEVLTQRSMFLRGEEISSPLTVEQVSILPAALHTVCAVAALACEGSWPLGGSTCVM